MCWRRYLISDGLEPPWAYGARARGELTTC